MAAITSNIRQYFETHKEVKELFFTNDHLEDRGGDQLAFFTEDSANTHAKNLKESTVTRITRSEVMDAPEDALKLDDGAVGSETVAGAAPVKLGSRRSSRTSSRMK